MIPKVSVIIYDYNDIEKLKKCVDSLINQTVNELEIIIINDGKDYEELAKKDDRILVLNQENESIISTIKTGIRNSSGEFVSLVKSSEILEIDMYEKLIEHYNLANIMFDCNICNKLYITKIAKELLEELDDRINDAEELVFNSRYLQKLFDEHKKYEIELNKLENHMKTIMCQSTNEYVNSDIANRVPQYIIDTKELQDKKIAIYAAGLMGQDVYWQLKSLEYDIVIQVDKNYLHYKDSKRPIYSIDKLLETEYDVIVIAIIQEEIAMDAKENLVNMGIDPEKIIWRKPVKTF